jgi:ferredoxin-NADP reductase
VLIEAPSGVFTPPVDGARPVPLIANGIGITPFVWYPEAVAAAPSGRAAPIYLLHGCRGRHDHPLSDRVDRLARNIAGLRRITAYSRPEAHDLEAQRFDVEGRIDIDALRAGGLLPYVTPGRPLASICGSAGFIAAMQGALARWGLPRFDIFTEALFLRGGSAPALEALRHHHRRHRAILWMAPAPGSILDAALTAGGALRSGCRVGQYESCIVEVHEVQFAHRVPFEGDPGSCRACQAVPLTDLTIAP